MAEVALFHHAQGLTPGGVAFAEELRRAGHAAHAPDLYDGRIFATLEEGVAHAKEIGEVIERGLRAVEGGPPTSPARPSSWSRRSPAPASPTTRAAPSSGRWPRAISGLPVRL